MKQGENQNDNVQELQKMMFDQIRRLSDPNVDLEKEIKRSQAISAAGTVVINAAKVQIDAVRVAALKDKTNPKQKALNNGPAK